MLNLQFSRDERFHIFVKKLKYLFMQKLPHSPKTYPCHPERVHFT
jgi:hypothetical protein